MKKANWVYCFLAVALSVSSSSASRCSLASGQLLSIEEMKVVRGGACDDSCIQTDDCQIECFSTPCLDCASWGTKHKRCAGEEENDCVVDPPNSQGCGKIMRGDCQAGVERCIHYEDTGYWCPQTKCHDNA